MERQIDRKEKERKKLKKIIKEKKRRYLQISKKNNTKS